MSKATDFVRNHKKAVILLAIVILVAIVIGVVLSGKAAAAGTEPEISTLKLSRMDIEQIVTATGSVRSVDSRNVTSQQTSKVVSVAVTEGQTVKKGDTLCIFDTSALDLNIAATQKSIDAAKAQSGESAAQAKRMVTDANDQYNYDKERLDREAQEAWDALETGKEAAAKAEKDAKAAAAKAEKDAKAAEAKAEKDAKEAAAKAEKDAKATGANQASAPTADATQIPSAGTSQNPAAGATGGDPVSALQAAYDAAVATRDATLRADQSAIKNAEDALKNQQLMDSTSQLQNQLDAYLLQKEDAVVKSPIDGAVTAANAKADSMPGMETPLFVIQDLSKLEVSASVPEYDATKLAQGMDVHVLSDALQGQEWNGTILSISPVATDAGGNFTVVISVTSPLEGLKSGMSAKVNVVCENRENVFAVPYGALIEKENGETVIYALDEATGQTEAGTEVETSKAGESETSGSEASRSEAGSDGADGATETREVVVTAGLETDYYVEISGSGLVEGMTINIDPEGLNKDAPSESIADMF
jgi:multidrug efflux pump subunit AcrA (membrane-fusion protein)